jgi:hypothetical protein
MKSDLLVEYLIIYHFYIKLAKIDKILLLWKGKYMSICEKITMINSLVISPYGLFVKLYEQKIFHFIWNGNPDKIKQAYLYNEYEFGGQK